MSRVLVTVTLQSCANSPPLGSGNEDAQCNLRLRRGVKVESRTTNEKKTQQGGPARARESRENQYRPYIEEQLRSAEVFNNSIAGRAKEERTANGPNTSRLL
ncbi:hypothetical protein TNCV_1376701 [Trichonephila clavipes]|nr:hypothetical protein TNCV_1376701 [Trichonephila clavipes]